MTRRALAARIANLAGLADHQAARVLQVLPAIVAAELAASGRLEWRGFGTFTVRTYPARKIHNPATGKTMALPERKSVTFKPSLKIRAKFRAARRSQAARRPVTARVKKTRSDRPLQKGDS